MAMKPILFSGPMVRAILDGRKTQTRRVIKPQPVMPFSTFHDHILDEPGLCLAADGFTVLDSGPERRIGLHYASGDLLWVREQHYLTDDGEAEAVVYTSDDEAVAQHHSDIARMQAQYGLSEAWARPHLRIRPSIHMPRWASRLTLTITDVRVQRVQEISETDARSEGVDPYRWSTRSPGGTLRNLGSLFYRQPFIDLWDDLNAERGFGWDQNPWVAAYTFTVQRGNIDQLRHAPRNEEDD